MQYTTEYLTTTIHHQTELEFERNLERRRIGHERAEEQRASVRLSPTRLAADRSRDQHAPAGVPAIRMRLASLISRLRSMGAGSGRNAETGVGAAPAPDTAAPDGAPVRLPAAGSSLSETTERQSHRELAHR